MILRLTRPAPVTWSTARRRHGAAVAALFLAAACPGAAPTQPARTFDAEVAARFARVEEWRGQTELYRTRTLNHAGASEHRRRQEELVSHGTFTLRRDTEWKWNPARGSFRWRGNGRVSGYHEIQHERRTLTGSFRGSYERWSERYGGVQPWKDWHFEVFLPDRHFSVHSGAPDGDLAVRRLGEKAYIPHGSTGLVTEAIDETSRNFLLALNLTGTPADRTRHVNQVIGGPGVLTLSLELPLADQGRTLGEGVLRSRVILYPIYEDVEVEVTLPGYADWRPRGNIGQPTRAGSALAARAVLKSRSGRTRTLPEVDHFRFELLDTSREPGICLNWPLNATDRDPDLRLVNFATEVSGEQMAAAQKFFVQWGLSSAGDYDLASMPPGGLPPLSFGVVSEDGQKAELRAPPKDKAGQPYAEVAIECFDFGAKSELRVVCVLKDGREIVGLMKSESGEQDLIRLPQRAGPDWVAEKWRRENDVLGLAASDDEEKIAGQTLHGDGFTLYEEYRGWIVNGRHVTGDPKRKDFFVLNQRGADFRGGIDLFARASKLRVHSALRDGKEMSEDQRRMNANRRDGPHRVAQHGVILARGNGFAGGSTVPVDGVPPGRAFRPRDVAKIFMEWSSGGRGGSLFSEQQGVGFNLSARDAALAWDRGVAHELLHAVGVDHHGEGRREKVCCYFQGPGAPLNPTKKPRYVSEFSLAPHYYAQGTGVHSPESWSDDRGPAIVLRWEDTQRDVFEDDLAEYQRKRDIFTTANATPESQQYFSDLARKIGAAGRSASWLADYAADEDAGYHATRVIWVGAKNGTDSGHELCIMKYYFADAHRIEGQANAYYLVRPGTVRAGRELCHSPAGTGTNAPTHKPQPRFGDADAGRGNCFAQVCPNDAHPPRQL